VKKIYLIEGDMVPLSRHRGGTKFYDAWAEAHMVFTNVIESQHMQDRPFIGPLAIQATFYLGYPDGMSLKRRTERDGCYYTNRPTLGALTKVIEDMCSGLLFEEPATIVSMSIEKRVSTHPRLTLLISEVEDAKRDGNEEKTPQGDDR
jgi:Holliday junction resolvase RusA-like endonuclease